MARQYEDPVAHQDGDDEIRYTHPAFGSIGASRVSGRVNLYDSDFDHQNYVTISIRRSELHRHLSKDWHHPREELIQVAISEAQWATFVSSMNVGGGVPCTIERHNGQMIPGLPPPVSPAHTFKGEIEKTMAGFQQAIKELTAGMDGPLPKTKVAELRRQLEHLARGLTNSTAFVAESFDEHVETTIEKAKIEINAYAVGMVARTGIEALAGKQPVALEFQPESAAGDKQDE